MPLWLDLWIEEVEAPAHKDSLDRWLKNCTGAGSVSPRGRHQQKGSTEITRKTEDRHRREEAKYSDQEVQKSSCISLSRRSVDLPVSASLISSRSRSLSLAPHQGSLTIVRITHPCLVRSVRHGKPSDSLGVVQFSISLVFRSLAFRSVSLRH